MTVQLSCSPAAMTAAHQLSPLLLVASAESCSESGPMARLADVTVGCRDRPGMGWMTTLAGTVLSKAWVRSCPALPGSCCQLLSSRLPCCRVCCRTLGQSESTEGLVMEKSRKVTDTSWEVQRRPSRCLTCRVMLLTVEASIPGDLDIGPHQVSCQL